MGHFWTRRGLALIVVGCALSLGGCAGPSADSPPAVQTPAAVPPKKAPIPPPPPKPPQPTPPSSPAAKAVPGELVGKSEADVHQLLGDAKGEHPDGAARVQTYAGKGCILDVVLFLDVSRGEWTVLSYELTSTAKKRPVITCYRQMRDKK